MAQMKTKKNLSICLYRSLLRLESRLCTVSQTQAKRHEVAHRDLLRKEIQFFGSLQRSDNSESHETLRALARQSFLLPPESNQDILDRQQTAFLALSLISTRIESYGRKNWQPRSSELKFRVGQIVQIPKTKQVGVIVGYDQTCNQKRRRTFMSHRHRRRVDRDLERGQNQPYYMVLSDFDKFYIPEENLSLYKEDVSVIYEQNDDLEHYFERFCPELSQFIPNESLKESYPDDF